MEHSKTDSGLISTGELFSTSQNAFYRKIQESECCMLIDKDGKEIGFFISDELMKKQLSALREQVQRYESGDPGTNPFTESTASAFFQRYRTAYKPRKLRKRIIRDNFGNPLVAITGGESRLKAEVIEPICTERFPFSDLSKGKITISRLKERLSRSKFIKIRLKHGREIFLCNLAVFIRTGGSFSSQEEQAVTVPPKKEKQKRKHLTLKERFCIAYNNIDKGLSNKELAIKYDCSPKTISKHLREMADTLTSKKSRGKKSRGN